MEKRVSPRGRTYFWSASDPPERYGEPQADVRELADGFVTLTPLHIDMTHRALLDRFSAFSWSIE